MFECVKFVNTLPHILTMKTLGELLQGSCWVEAIVQAEIAKPGTANSPYEHHLHAHEKLTKAQQLSYLSFKCKRMTAGVTCMKPTHWIETLKTDDISENKPPQFQYWATVLELELFYVRSLAGFIHDVPRHPA